nr:hypothetical protein [Aurantiacibacter sp. 219JJ12-13]MDP5263511.1 hypothetical protein [Aurantiacibacter sp. 219JJ12-13]
MRKSETIQQLGPIFRATNAARPVLLLGAGASFSSGVPLADESVRRLAKTVYADRVMHGSVPSYRVKASEWERWLAEHHWFRPDLDLAENFPLVVEHLLRPQEYRRDQLLRLMQPTKSLGDGYLAVADFVRRGLVRTTLTTNFDPCLPMALDSLRPHLPSHSEVNRTSGDLAEFDLYSRSQIVWLHGKAEGYSDKNLIEEVAEIDPALKSRLLPLLEDSPLVVIGYRGAEPSITRDLLLSAANDGRSFRKGIYWCVRGEEDLHPNVQELQEALKGNFFPIRIDGFDEVMAELAEALEGEDLYVTRESAQTPTGGEPFDERPLPDGDISEVDLDLALVTLQEYCANLNRQVVTRETLLPLMRELGLLLSVDGKEVPTNGCFLLFGKNPRARYPHAVTRTTIADKRRTVFEGNLLSQRRELLDWIALEGINPTLRVKRGSLHEEKSAYANRALVELMINLLVHRDYERKEPAVINVEPGEAIEFRNPGKLSDDLAKKITFDDAGRFHPIKNGTDARNRSLCDIFLGIRAMEWKGTGLPDVEELAEASGGDASFRVSTTGNFTARITRLPATAGSDDVARDDRPIGTYVFNILPALTLPQSVTRLKISERPNEKSCPEAYAAGVVIIRDREIWSFSSPGLLKAAFAPIALECTEFARSDLEESDDQRRIISWLIRRHFEQHLNTFSEQGLVLEGGRGSRRAYFAGVDGKPRALKYDSPKRRNIRREVVKQRAEGERAWFENEGFGYGATPFDDKWGIRIKPFYMFTGKDALTPLPSFARGAKATRRMKFDRNKNVEDDLTFWSRFLGQGRQTLNIGQETCDELIFDSAFLTVDLLTTSEDKPA